MFAQSIAGQPAFWDSPDRSVFLQLVGRLVERRGWWIYSYCLMSTHYHLLFETEEKDLAAGIQWLNSCYAATFNRRHGSKGHVFGRRYGAVYVTSDAQLLEEVRYIALNPVRAGICQRPDQYFWSSYAASIGLREPSWFLSADRVLRCFGADVAAAQRALRDFVEDGLRRAA